MHTAPARFLAVTEVHMANLTVDDAALVYIAHLLPSLHTLHLFAGATVTGTGLADLVSGSPHLARLLIIDCPALDPLLLWAPERIPESCHN